MTKQYPDNPTKFVIVWMRSGCVVDVAWKMKRPVSVVVEWSTNLRAKGVKLPPRPVRHQAESQEDE